MKTTSEMIKVMEAYERGEKIEYWDDHHNKWIPCNAPTWDWRLADYRIAPKSKRKWDVWSIIVEHPSGSIDFLYSLYTEDPRNTGIVPPTDKILAIKKITLTEGDGVEELNENNVMTEVVFNKHTTVVATEKISEEVPKGSIGYILHVFKSGADFEVEFTVDGKSVVEVVFITQIDRYFGN